MTRYHVKSFIAQCTTGTLVIWGDEKLAAADALRRIQWCGQDKSAGASLRLLVLVLLLTFGISFSPLACNAARMHMIVISSSLTSRLCVARLGPVPHRGCLVATTHIDL